MAGAFPCVRKHALCTCICVRVLCVYVGACLDGVSWHVHVYANMRAGRVAVSGMNH